VRVNLIIAMAVDLLAMVAWAGVPASDAVFTTKPAATKDGDQTKIAFAVSAPTDVEVAVLGTDGRIARHLAAGVLGGKKPPPEPLGPGLAQTLTWDGKDDSGKPATGIKVSVRLGMKVKLNGFFGENVGHLEDIAGMAVDSRGMVFVLSFVDRQGNVHEGLSRQILLYRFAKTGRYECTLMPPSANLSAKDLPPDFTVPVPGDGLFPRTYNRVYPCLAPLLASPDDLSHPVTGTWEMSTNLTQDGYLHIRSGKICWAVHGQTGAIKNNPPEAPELSWPGRVTDAAGRTLICEAAGAVKVLGKDGKEINSIKIESPTYVACDPKTGAVYVLSAETKYDWTGWKSLRRTVVRFSGSGADAKETARLELPTTGAGSAMAVDTSGEVPLIWVAAGISRGKTLAINIKARGTLYRLEDRGGKLVQTDTATELGTSPTDTFTRLAVHPDTEVVIGRGLAPMLGGFDGLSGKPLTLPMTEGLDMAVGLDGNWYLQGYPDFSGPILRYDRDIKPLPVAGQAVKVPNMLGNVQGREGCGAASFGLAADATGRVYSLQLPSERVHTRLFVGVFGPDGKGQSNARMKDDPVLSKRQDVCSAIWGPTVSDVGGIGLDWENNIYIGVVGLPADCKAPAGFENERIWRGGAGCVVKFAPTGGAVLAGAPPAGGHGLAIKGFDGYSRSDIFLEGALVAYPGLGCMAGSGNCACRQPMFQVDGWGRIWMPDAMTFSVNVVDNTGNQILHFGQYGNADSRGVDADSLVKKPDIPFGWPEAVGVSNKAVYVADVLNRRIVRLLKQYAAEEFCEVK